MPCEVRTLPAADMLLCQFRMLHDHLLRFALCGSANLLGLIPMAAAVPNEQRNALIYTFRRHIPAT